MSKEHNKRTYKGRYETSLTSRHLSSILSKVLTNINTQQKQRPDLLLAFWPQVVGPAIAQLTRAVCFK